MKVIDIMQKVANKEIFKFRIDDVNYYVDKSNYICEEDGTKVEWYIDDEWLNMNAEIIEEDKKIEKITLLGEEIKLGSLSNWLKDKTINEEKIASCIEANAIKINEIIDYLEENKK